MDALGQNLKFAARQLRRNPGFTVTVILTLALSIGANTAIFSIVNALMLKSLPYSHPERMGTIYTRITGAKVLRRTAPREWRAVGAAARQCPRVDLGCFQSEGLGHQSPGGDAGAVSPGGAHLGALSRCAGGSSR